ncbi:hypothetical protein LCGC14_2332370 [marine sediment metagenome]|uniref:Uncharacterized protein n=1 Tax=marine sediment metagenome TaxID=412755 RepID=A0A0F9CFA7_9ZZZZ
MKVTLTVQERFSVVGMLPKEGELLEQSIVRDIREKVLPDTKELKSIEAHNDQQGRLTWNSSKEKDKEIELTKIEVGFLKTQVERINKEKKINQSNIGVCEKIQNIKKG